MRSPQHSTKLLLRQTKNAKNGMDRNPYTRVCLNLDNGRVIYRDFLKKKCTVVSCITRFQRDVGRILDMSSVVYSSFQRTTLIEYSSCSYTVK